METTNHCAKSRYLTATQVGEVLSTLGMQIAVHLSEVLATTSADGTVSFHTPAGVITLSAPIQEGGAA